MGPVSFSLFSNIKWERANETLMCQEGNSSNSVEDWDDIERHKGACGQRK